MHKLGFADAWIRLIMNCVKSVSYSMVVNGNVVGNIIPSRGIRQGDPISPYLFILYVEAFSSLLHHAHIKGLFLVFPLQKMVLRSFTYFLLMIVWFFARQIKWNGEDF